MLDTVREVSTPELVALHLRLAGPIPRSLAWLLDALIRLGVMLALSGILRALGSFGWGLITILFFVLEWFYPVLFEVLGKGATPGKRALGLVVCHDDGTPIGWGASFTRNLLRAADFLPMAYGFGLICMFLSPEFRRIGDIVAGTVVVHRESTGDRTIPEATPLAPNARLSRETQRAVLAFAERAPRVTPARAEELAALVPHLTNESQGTESVRQLLGLANYLIGRRV